MKIGFDGRYIFEKSGGVAGLRQYSTQLLVAMAAIAPDNLYHLYLREPLPTQSDNPVAALIQSKPGLIIPHIVSGELKLPTALWYQSALPTSLRRDKLDIMHCPDFLAPFWSFGPHLPKVITIHDLNVLRFRENFTPRTYWAWRLQAQVSSRRATLILTDSEASKQDIIAWLKVPASKIRVTSAAAEPAFAPASSQEIERVKTKFGLERYIFWVGSLIPQKNLERLVRAFASLKKKGEMPQKLVLGGQNAWKSQQYRQLVATLGLEGEVLFPGFLDTSDLIPLYSGADLFVFPSLYEGFGLPPLEAMACGTPIAVSDVSSLPEIAGEAAEYFDPLNIEQIATAIERVLTNTARAEELRKRGLERAIRFSWEYTARQTLTAYQTAIAAGRREIK